MNISAGIVFCARMNWAIFPLAENKKIPITSDGFKSASKESSTVMRWWGRNPKLNIGVATGVVSGVTVVDVDVKNNAPGMDSIKLIRGLTPKTFTVETPSGGYHLYYHSEGPIRSRNKFLPGIDIKSDGGYVVGPGSEIDGKKYKITNDCEPVRISSGLAVLIAHEKTYQPVRDYKPMTARIGVDDIVIGPGNWHYPVLKAVARMVARGDSDQMILSRAERYTLPGYSVFDTLREMSAMIAGARRKGFCKCR